jgi:hypothetical protein
VLAQSLSELVYSIRRGGACNGKKELHSGSEVLIPPQEDVWKLLLGEKISARSESGADASRENAARRTLGPRRFLLCLLRDLDQFIG